MGLHCTVLLTGLAKTLSELQQNPRPSHLSHGYQIHLILKVFLDYPVAFQLYLSDGLPFPLPTSNSLGHLFLRNSTYHPWTWVFSSSFFSRFSHDPHMKWARADSPRWAWRNNRGAKKQRVPGICRFILHMESTLVEQRNETLRVGMFPKMVGESSHAFRQADFYLTNLTPPLPWRTRLGKIGAAIEDYSSCSSHFEPQSREVERTNWYCTLSLCQALC